MKLPRLRFCAALLAPLLLLAPALAQAHGGGHAGMSCSGHEYSSSFIVVSMQCAGDFAISGGSISSPLGVIVRSGGDLSLSGVNVSAPFVEFISQGALSFGGGGKLDGSTWSILDGQLSAVGSHTTQPVVVRSGSEVFTGLPSHPLATASTLSWEIFSTGTDCGPFFDLPGHGALDLHAGADLIGLYFGALALAADLTSGSGSIFIEIAGHGGALITLSPVAAVPEPGTWALMLLGLAGLLLAARRGRRA
ncbi:MAG: hypothetical protein JWN73_3356 [Betaproteobacteria bacterium]|nr:hypothetical protein [Betaproteobacteria bacterium]